MRAKLNRLDVASIEKNNTSIHEAGHLLMAILFGLKWKHATVKDQDFSGRIASGHVCYQKPDNLDHFLMLWLAGYAAEWRMNISISYGSRVEFNEAVQICRDEGIDDPEVYPFAMLDQAIKKLRNYERELTQLAEFLKHMGTITPDALDTVKETIQIK